VDDRPRSHAPRLRFSAFHEARPIVPSRDRYTANSRLDNRRKAYTPGASGAKRLVHPSARWSPTATGRRRNRCGSSQSMAARDSDVERIAVGLIAVTRARGAGTSYAAACRCLHLGRRPQFCCLPKSDVTACWHRHPPFPYKLSAVTAASGRSAARTSSSVGHQPGAIS